MTKYELIFGVNDALCGVYDSEKQAQEALLERIEEQNKNSCEDDCTLTVFDYYLKKIEVTDPQKAVTDFEEARKFLGGTANRDYKVARNMDSNNLVKIEDVSLLVDELNPSHVKALIAFNRLATIAQAWNKIDRFVPDFSNRNQEKWFPWFTYDTKTAGFVFAVTKYAPSNTNANIGSRLCFKSSSRARQFGEMFVELYNDMFLLR